MNITGTNIRVILVNVSSFRHSDERPVHRLCGNEWHKRRKRTDEVTERKKERNLQIMGEGSDRPSDKVFKTATDGQQQTSKLRSFRVRLEWMTAQTSSLSRWVLITIDA